MQVATTLMRPDYSVQIAWMVAPLNGEPKIVDIVAGGFSMRISQRDDCANLLRRCNNSIPALIETLRRQAAMES